MFEIRQARNDDAAWIAAIQIKAWSERLNAWAPEWFIRQFKQDVQAEKYAQRIADSSYDVLVAEEDGMILGFASKKPNTSEPLNFTHQIGALYVDPQHEKKGIGKALLEALLECSMDDTVIVWTFRDNIASRKLYESCGGVILPYTEAADMDLDIPHVSYGWNA